MNIKGIYRDINVICTTMRGCSKDTDNRLYMYSINGRVGL